MRELLVRNKKFMVSLCVILFVVAFAVIGSMVVRDPLRRYGALFQPPSSEFIMGTDYLGRDVLANLCVGTRTSLMVGLFAGSISILMSVFIGGIGAYKGGLADEGCNLFANLMLVFPMIPLLIVLSAFLETRSLLLVGLLISIVSWPWSARAVRSQVLSLKEREFVNLARVSGMKERTILIREIFPNLLAPIFIMFIYAFGGAILAEAGISMIGLGPTNTVSLGTMLYWASASDAFRMGIWWWFFPPGAILTILMVALFIMHASVDEIFNPKLRTG